MKRWLLRLLSTFILAMMLAIGYYGYHIWSAAKRLYEPPKLSKSALRSEPVDIAKDPVALLFLGVDERQGDRGRSDSIIVATTNPGRKSVVLTNIPRDTLVKIPGRLGRDKINHSYAYGGIELTRKTVEHFLQIPIDGYVKVNMQGLKEIVNELGGIEVDVPFTFHYNGYLFKKGKMHVNGDQALAFARMRKNDPSGDFGRMKRQQELIRGIIHKGTTLHSLTNLANILEQLGGNIKTDISPVQLFQLQRLYANLPDEQIRSVSIKGKNTLIDGVYYYKVDENEKMRVHQQLARQLDWSPGER
ncbi:LCP family protein [Laceyella putida]|uniref:LCP family protein n=1 Tax=Laceyella putida TaxID=110101 RepID=A0ABW2RGB4_9BACL